MDPFYQPGDMTLSSSDGTSWAFPSRPSAHDALHFEAAEFARLIDAGVPQSPLRTHAESIGTLRTIDEIRRKLGIVFDEELQLGGPRAS